MAVEQSVLVVWNRVERPEIRYNQDHAQNVFADVGAPGGPPPGLQFCVSDVAKVDEYIADLQNARRILARNGGE